MEHAQEEDLLTLLLRVSQEIRAYSTTQVLGPSLSQRICIDF
jgi:hypothetical protein